MVRGNATNKNDSAIVVNSVEDRLAQNTVFLGSEEVSQISSK